MPLKVMRFLQANISPREMALGVCLAMFLGFIPLNGPIALLLMVFFLVFRINRMSTLVALPLFKAVYLMGASRLTESVGTYLLAGADYLAGMWRLITHMPVIAYLDINNTLVAGGLAVSAALFVPVYLISKKISAVINAKYLDRIRNSAFMARISGRKRAAGAAGPGAAPKKTLRHVNIPGIIMIIAALLIFHFGVGLIVSPAVTSFLVSEINKHDAAIHIGKANFWPLTLSVTINDFKVFDPDNKDVRIAKADDVSVGISPLALLRRQIVFSNMRMSGAEIDLVGEPDGSFNVERLAKKEAAPGESAWQLAMKKKDWFGKACEMVKSRSSGEAREKAREAAARARKVTKTVEELPKGRLVRFKTQKDLYLFEIRNLTIDNGRVNIEAEGGQKVEVERAKVRLGGLKYDPENGMALDLVEFRGVVNRGGSSAGKFNIFFSKGSGAPSGNVRLDVELDDIDLDAVRFIYEDSLPVKVKKGALTMRSKTNIRGDSIDSRNDIKLKNHLLEQKGAGATAVGIVPVGVIIDALNMINPAELKFNITGTVEKPEFGGFQESLMKLVKPYITDIGEKLKKKGIDALKKLINKGSGDKNAEGVSSADASGQSEDINDTINSLKSLFKK
ncbi:MAG: DUF748 domain-containing protein [Candidatus Omnitrophota bacterium]